MSKGGSPVLTGVVTQLGENLECTVRLDSGEVVRARIPRHTARLMFRVVPGARVRVQPHEAGRVIVLGHDGSRG